MFDLLTLTVRSNFAVSLIKRKPLLKKAYCNGESKIGFQELSDLVHNV